MASLRQASNVQASGAIDYQLHTLGWKAFQDLCGSVLSVVLGQSYQTFADSADGGRDGAFHGDWRQGDRESLAGSFTVQCKHTTRRDQSLTLASIKEELKKARRLAGRGLAENYLLLTNYTLTGVVEERIRTAFLEIDGVNNCLVYGKEWLSRQIHESARLRMLVPKVYGLGDLSQLLDERAYDQAQELLSTMGDDLAKFVVTEAYRKSVEALADHSFVLLVGEPASGKSTIAAALSVGATDRWGCNTVWATGAEEVRSHWNPHEPRQMFWVDDAFGATQLDWSSVDAWNRAFPVLDAALRNGARVLLTSRDYVYRSARDSLKGASFPLLERSQVVIEVEKLSHPEREQILYNHIRRGKQPKEFRKAIKPLLPAVAAHKNFRPEAARRLGNPLFTAKLRLNQSEVLAFVERPMEHLLEVLRGLEDASRAALAVVFMRNGALPSPLKLSKKEREATELLGGSVAGVSKSLRALEGTLVLRVLEEGKNIWKFKHPTVRDAFAELVAGDSELLNIYLTGTPAGRLVHEVSCGTVGVKGVKVVVPRSHYGGIAAKLGDLMEKTLEERDLLCRFLTHRCGKQFLQRFLKEHREFVDRLHVGSYLSAVSDVRLIARLHELGLLPESNRRLAVRIMTQLAVETPDAGFLKQPFSSLFSEDEKVIALQRVARDLLPRIGQVVDDWAEDYSVSSEYSPDVFFHELDDALRVYAEEFQTDSRVVQEISDARELIEETVSQLQGNWHEREQYEFERASEGVGRVADSGGRSIFDDIDV